MPKDGCTGSGLGITQLWREARVIVTQDTTEGGMLAAARDAEGLLFRIKPNCTHFLMTACARLTVVGRHGVGFEPCLKGKTLGIVGNSDLRPKLAHLR
jgi:phosphoglycerate dehydrogenase-like enzyme